VAHTLTQLPFRIDRAASTELTDQVERGLLSAIQSGVFQPGDRLPGVRELARELGTSNVVVTRAVRRLVDQGRLSARPRAGIRVLQPSEKTWRAHVLWVGGLSESYFFAVREETLAQDLDAANVRMSSLCYTPNDAGSLAKLRASLSGMAITHVVRAISDPAIEAACAEYQVPLIDCAEPAGPYQAEPRARVRMDPTAAMRDMVAHWETLGRPQLAVIANVPPAGRRACERLRALGVEAPLVPNTWQSDPLRGEATERTGYATASRLVEAGELPESLYITDDHMARGVLTALLVAGLRIPEDLQMIVATNRGNGLVYRHPFTRIEVDPFQHGHALARAVLETIDHPNDPPRVHTTEPRFIVGGTTIPR